MTTFMQIKAVFSEVQKKARHLTVLIMELSSPLRLTLCCVDFCSPKEVTLKSKILPLDPEGYPQP